MKRVFTYLLALTISFLFVCCGQEIEPVSVANVSLSDSTVEMVEGETYVLTVTIEPSNAENQNVIWTSSNSSVATVTDGVVTAIKVGTATITVKSDDGGKTATCNVTVIAKEIPVTGISLDQTSIELMEGDEFTLVAIVKPDDATNKNVTWTSSDESVATVNNSKISAHKAGQVIITARTQDGNFIAECYIFIFSQLAKVDYVDEYGINHGRGIAIGDVVWAPVNCGYHEKDYPYGKLYQWGRKYGQGYSGELYDSDANLVGEISDFITPDKENGPVSLNQGQSEDNSNKFYYSGDLGDWVNQRNDYLWNFDSEEKPVKTQYDPCPEGWRVPTYNELDYLSKILCLISPII